MPNTFSQIYEPISRGSEQPFYNATTHATNPLFSEQVYAIQNLSSFDVLYAQRDVTTDLETTYRDSNNRILRDDWHELKEGAFVILEHPEFDATSGDHLVFIRPDERQRGRIHLVFTPG